MACSSQQEAVLENGCFDRISDLLDCLLCHILSFLPTKNAVATSILSSRWKAIWTFVPRLYLDNTNISAFPDIVSRVFAQHKAPYLREFCLDVDTWVRASISPNLEELDVDSHPIESKEMFELPRSIFSCTNLVNLNLSGKILLSFPSSFKLPSLKILHLWLTSYNDEYNPDWKILSGCPVLEDLSLGREAHLLIEGEEEDYDEVFKLEIYVPTLKRLKIVFMCFELEDPDYELEINTPALEYFLFMVLFVKLFSWKNYPTKANVDIDEFDIHGEKDDYEDTVHYTPKVLGLLRGFYNVKLLSLSYGATECLSFAYGHYDLPMFHNLAQLNYNLRCCNWHMLWYLLDQAPNLEVLVVKKSKDTVSPSYAHLSVCLKQPLDIPRDLSPHLTTFYFRGFQDLKDEL